MVRIVWPPQSSVIGPKRFPDVAATMAHTMAQLFSRAHVVVAALKVQRKL